MWNADETSIYTLPIAVSPQLRMEMSLFFGFFFAQTCLTHLAKNKRLRVTARLWREHIGHMQSTAQASMEIEHCTLKEE